jgi:acetyl-CoA synthetase
MDRYWGLPERTERTFEEGWLLTDDLAHRDTDGYYWYEGRGDDVIISSGYRIGPFEVENSLIEQSVVAEAAVIGLPDDQRGQRVKAFVVPTEQPADPDAAAERLKQHVKEQQARHAYPREVEFVDELPKTATGKIQRYKLEERDADASRGSN